MSKLHFLKEGCLLCLQFILLLLKDMTKVKLLLLIISLNVLNDSLLYRKPRGWTGRGWESSCCIVLSGRLQPTSSGSYCPNYHLYKTDRGLEHQRCSPRRIHQIFVLPHSCSCSMSISVLLRGHLELPFSAVTAVSCCCTVRNVVHQ